MSKRRYTIEHRKIADALCDIAGDLSDDWKDEKRVMRQAVEALRSRQSTTEPTLTWRPIETAPRDGSHILAYRLPIGIRFTNNTNPPTVVHWFGDPELPGFYTSVNELAPERPFEATHWQPLPAPPVLTSGEPTKEIVL